jgi:hypothetical protein
MPPNWLPWERPQARSPRTFIALAVAVMVAPAALAALPSADDAVLDQMSVRELMRLDAALALEQSRERLRKADASSQPAHRRGGLAHSGALELVAIYGVGKKLLAEVNIGARPHVYVRGQALPVGVRAGASPYLLRGISGSCVHLERQDEAHTLCLPVSMGASR